MFSQWFAYAIGDVPGMLVRIYLVRSGDYPASAAEDAKGIFRAHLRAKCRDIIAGEECPECLLVSAHRFIPRTLRPGHC